MTDSKQKSAPMSGFSRREFLRGSGAVAAATALQTQTAVALDDQGPQVVRGEKKITLNVNGKDVQVKAEPRTTLLDVLRYQLDLTGAKPVTVDGSSGASTILIDDKPVAASTTLAMAATGKKIQTVESLGGERPDEVVKAFVSHDAQQCGFCTPGFVVAVRAFLNKNPDATEAEVRAGLNGNLCRCGTYANIVEAALAVVKGG
ncbi:MAG TPA: (2Fe-2S)-binding protein [Pirellulaceae bacterium]|jgi:xanthine dehydrogenase YagT iron-sulfur-binding subunit|nr:(2Fe-2S)-binding protein [Pirellulaceae bacterium]